MADVTIKTPEEYISEHTVALKADLKTYDIQINKLGLIGYFLNMMGNTQFDLTTYYNYLFNEGFVATAQNNSNLYMHASIYNYLPGFATTSTATGSFIFDFSFMPAKSSNITKREITYSNLSFTIDNIEFNTSSTYKFVEENETYYGMIYKADGSIEYIPSSTSSIECPFIGVYQYSKITVTGTTGNYNFSTYYPYEFTLDSGYLAALDIQVDDGTGTYTSYDVKQMKYLEDSFANVVFFRPLESNTYLIQFGSGVRGNYVPNTNFKINIYNTLGSGGDINITSKVKLSDVLQNTNYINSFDYGATIGDNTVCLAKQISDNDEQTYVSSSVKDILTINFEYSNGGKDQLTGNDLRKNIVRYIQTRDNLISETDYYNVATKYFEDFKILFKKTSFIDNTIYLYRSFRNKYQLPIHSLTYTQKLLSEYSTKPQLFVAPSTTTGNLTAGTYSYYLRATDCFGETVSSDLMTCAIDGINNTSIELQWPPITGAVKYIIYGRPDSSGIYQYWETYDSQYLDNGNVGQYSTPFYTTEPVIFKPVFMINNIEFISPFIFKYNSYFKWYDGYILYNNLVTNFTSIDRTYQTDSLYDVPMFYFNIRYDFNFRKTYVYIKSYQDITNFQPILTINELNLQNYTMEYVDENTYQYIYTNNEYGLIFGSIDLSITIKHKTTGLILVTATSSGVQQTVDVKDQIRLPIYSHTANNVVIGIPLIKKSIYDDDPEYYLEKIYEFMFSNSLTENRMATDEVQFRFLNSYNLATFYSNNILIQQYPFDIVFPLKLKITCYLDDQYLKTTTVDLISEKETLYLLLADNLQVNYSGTSIRYYNSQIIDLVHTGRLYIKTVNVEVTDSNNNVIDNGLETLTDAECLSNIQQSISTDTNWNNMKLNILKFCPILWWWDINNIELIFAYNR